MITTKTYHEGRHRIEIVNDGANTMAFIYEAGSWREIDHKTFGRFETGLAYDWAVARIGAAL